ncbi:LacI family DNA-binding transcriptional regulator [Anaerocolumna xylanovorans]|uniref:Transcriptional regulator, LacI family n=1 Tax=Anaerocolumna xylanovorans DSM 12503 TaxID=1121345 RepID=A0A1M7YN00_9FIRM|nr:LacI family DNA-binding transcriptional regulator [Anaerocolumna xylanovorans]SHO53962.1 transcriptional regulator, LacI family [Anaerocolumna xylanovorans DSM 12503]
MTLKEVAAQAGVSVSTVSRIINSPDDSFARKEVRDRVWSIIKETGYTPNLSARELKRGKMKEQETPDGALACILGRTKTLEDDPFFAQLARVIEQQAMEQGYPVRLSYSVFDMKPNSIPEKAESFNADGAIILGRVSRNYMDFLEKQYKNLIYVGRNIISADCDQVICNGYEATQIAIKHLIACGHRRIGYIGEISSEVRYQAYLDTLREHGLDYSANLVSNCPQNGAGGYQGADYLLSTASPLPTAVFCATDITAIAALRRFTESKIKVPEQLSVISMDNIELSGYVSPMLTTVGMPIVEMGNIAVQTLIARIQKRHKLPMKIFLPNKLAIRESVTNLNAGAYI